MAIVMRMTWSGVTPEQYDEVRHRVNWVGNPSPGGDVHVASFGANGDLHCTDVWDSEEQLNTFLETRILPTVAAMGITSTPDVTIEACHELFVPHVNTITIPETDRILAATPV
ncbi:MAG: hypothetical protein WCD35_10110 [Mycobacteriales bacterium]